MNYPSKELSAVDYDAPEAAQDETYGSEKQCRGWLMSKVGAVAGSVALLAASASLASPNASIAESSPTHPLKYVGFVEPRLFTDDQARADQLASMIKDAGANSVRITVPYTIGEAGNVTNDWNSYCNAAGAAQKEDLNLTVTFQGHYADGSLGFVPTTLTDMKKFETTALVYEKALGGPPKPANPDVKKVYRCDTLPQKMTNFNFEIFNEWNLSPFVEPQVDSAGNLVSPTNMVHLLRRVYPSLKKEGRNLGVQMNVWAGALTSKHDPLGFIAATGAVIKKEKVKLPIFDAWTHHPYMPGENITDKHPNGDEVGVSDMDMLNKALRDAFGYQPRIIDDEFGVQPTVPSSELGSYDLPLIPNVSYVDEAGQAEQYRQSFSILSNCVSNVDGLFIFHLVDDKPAVSWGRSGILYPDGRPKGGYSVVQKAMNAVRSGRLLLSSGC